MKLLCDELSVIRRLFNHTVDFGPLICRAAIRMPQEGLGEIVVVYARRNKRMPAFLCDSVPEN